MAFTTTQLAAIESAIASGELTVEFDGKRVTYRSMSELREAYQTIRSALVADGVISNTEIRRSVATFSKD